jgi:hypothetical protein
MDPTESFRPEEREKRFPRIWKYERRIGHVHGAGGAGRRSCVAMLLSDRDCHKDEGGIMNDELGRQRQNQKAEIGNLVAKLLIYSDLARRMSVEPDHPGFFEKSHIFPYGRE